MLLIFFHFEQTLGESSKYYGLQVEKNCFYGFRLIYASMIFFFFFFLNQICVDVKCKLFLFPLRVFNSIWLKLHLQSGITKRSPTIICLTWFVAFFEIVYKTSHTKGAIRALCASFALIGTPNKTEKRLLKKVCVWVTYGYNPPEERRELRFFKIIYINVGPENKCFLHWEHLY